MKKQKTKKTVSMEALTETLRSMIADLKSVKGFQISEGIKTLVHEIANAIQGGNNDEAVRSTHKVVEASRSILTAFLRNAAIDKEEPGGMKPSFFTKEIRRRIEENYHEDLVAGLKAKHILLVEAVQSEKDGFTARIAAYNTMHQAVADADRDQNTRDVLHISRDTIKKSGKERRREVQRQSGVDTASLRREAMLADRKKQADEVLALL